jgi:hypothetical protein
MQFDKTLEKGGWVNGGAGRVALMAIATHIIFSCAVYGIWTATGDMIGADWGSCMIKVSIAMLLLIPFAISKTATLNGLFERV